MSLESCDCDRTNIHDCVCPTCRIRFLNARIIELETALQSFGCGCSYGEDEEGMPDINKRYICDRCRTLDKVHVNRRHK